MTPVYFLPILLKLLILDMWMLQLQIYQNLSLSDLANMTFHLFVQCQEKILKAIVYVYCCVQILVLPIGYVLVLNASEGRDKMVQVLEEHLVTWMDLWELFFSLLTYHVEIALKDQMSPWSLVVTELCAVTAVYKSQSVLSVTNILKRDWFLEVLVKYTCHV